MVGFLRSTVVLTVVVLIFTLTVQARTIQSKQCSKLNEVYNECGTACPNTCDDALNSYPAKLCTNQCVPGCFCGQGFVREKEESTSDCVKAEECRPTA